MSLATKGAQLGEGEIREWLEQLSLVSSGEEASVPVRELIRDGVLLCQLVNKIRPGSVDTVSTVAYIGVFAMIVSGIERFTWPRHAHFIIKSLVLSRDFQSLYWCHIERLCLHFETHLVHIVLSLYTHR